MKQIFFVAVAVLYATISTAQNSVLEGQVVDTGRYAVSTVVPILRQPEQVIEHTVVDEGSDRYMDRKERRIYKSRLFADRIDSLIGSRNYIFYPNSMQQMPQGLMRIIYSGYFYLGIFVDHVALHLPTERGISQYVWMLDSDQVVLDNYSATLVDGYWEVRFALKNGSNDYNAELTVSTVTGEAVLILVMPYVTMKYVGWLWREDNESR